MSWHPWFKHLGATGLEQYTQWTKVYSTDMAINAVASGHGLTLSVPYLCQKQLDAGELVMPFTHSHPNPVKRYMVYDANSARLARLQVFMDWLKAEMS